jgi:DNA mismatch repair protein MutL
MGIIHRLPISEIQKIAAGEVVERPANVVKELIENALDARATHITIEIADGGKSFIRVIDNGCGMDPQDAVTCFEHHATSKISSVHDLATVMSFGFRGEALSSIAAVSNVVLVTKQPDAPLATRVILDAGTVIVTEQVPHADGTDITVSNLLFNVPARRKFLRTTETESRQILNLIQAFCLAHPTIYFSYKSEGYSLVCPPTTSLSNRIAQLWQHGQTPPLLEIEKSELLSGAISYHGYGRFDRNWMFFFVNGRWIKNFTLGRAVLAGYANVLPTGKYPLAVISLTVPPETVDINVHPRKEELVFVNPRKIEQAITQAVKRALEASISSTLQASKKGWTAHSNAHVQEIVEHKNLPDQDIHFDEQQQTAASNPSAQQLFVSSSSYRTLHTEEDITLATHNRVNSVAPTTTTQAITTSQNIFGPSQEVHNYQLIGQLHKTYLLLEHEDGLLVIDQHAAHERILYERLDTKFADIASTQLIFPEIVEIAAHDIEVLIPHIPLIQQHGFGIDIVGTQQIAITATPVLTKNLNMQELLHFLISTIISLKALDATNVQRIMSEKLRAQMACKTAVKAGDVLQQEQMQQLLQDLYKTAHRFSCPHGRPTSWLIATYEIEKKFKRDYR